MRRYQPLPARVVKTSFYLDEELLWAAKSMAATDRVTLRTWLTRLVEAEQKRRQAKGKAA